MNSIPYTKEDRRANAHHLQRQFVQAMFNDGELINACHEAIRVASDDIWKAMHESGGCPVPYGERSLAEECYWTMRGKLMQATYAESGYQIWRSMRLNDGDPSQRDTYPNREAWRLAKPNLTIKPEDQS